MVKFLIHRPIAVLTSTLAILLLGLYAFDLIPISLMPKIDVPVITVQVNADDMSAQQLEQAIVNPLRSGLMQVSHLEDITSESTNGSGTIQLSFTHGTTIDYAFIEVNEKIDRSMGLFPKSVKRPRVIKSNTSDIPVFYLSMTLKDEVAPENKKATQRAISQDFVDFSRFTNQVIQKRIEQLESVAMVDITGLVESEIVLMPDEKKCNALGISIQDLESQVNANNVQLGSLHIKDAQYQYDVRLGNHLDNIEDIKSVYIRKGKRVFQLKDLATVIERPRKRNGLVLSDGKESVTMAIIKQSDSRMATLKKALDRLLKQLKKDYPKIDFKITRDQTQLLSFAIDNLLTSLFWGMLLAFVMMLLFLKNIKAALLIGIVVPISLVVCMLCFYFLEISINIISLSGLILAIGLMIDNSIIVIDNITQHRLRIGKLGESCVLGTMEVFRPLLSAALTTCAVFLPLVFISGITGVLFYDQSMAITVGLFVSLLISVTLLPVLYRLLYLKSSHAKDDITTKKGWFAAFQKLFACFTIMQRSLSVYEQGFRWVMRHQKSVGFLCLLLLALTVYLFNDLPKTQMPAFTQKETLLKIDWNDQINLETNKARTLALLASVTDTLRAQTGFVGLQQFIINKQGNASTAETVLYLEVERPKTLVKIKNNLSKIFQNDYPKARYEFQKVSNVFNLIFSQEENLVARLRPREKNKDFELLGLSKLWHQIQRKLIDVPLDPILWQQGITLLVNQDKMAIYGIDTQRLSNVLKAAFSKKEILKISDSNTFTPLIVGSEKKDFKQILQETTLVSKDTARLNISAFLRVVPRRDLKSVVAGKEGTYYPLAIPAQTKKEVHQSMDKVHEVVRAQGDYEVLFTGQFFKNEALVKQLIVILLISLVLLYFILAAQFESLTLPFIILLEVPLDLAGSFLLLKIFGMSINLMSMIGVVVMSGIIINDSILKVDTILQLQRLGHSLLRAILIAGQRRLAPILMTSLTTILALMPLFFYSGMGVELQAPLAVSLIGGMILGTLVSLYFIPLSYYYLQNIKNYVKR